MGKNIAISEGVFITTRISRTGIYGIVLEREQILLVQKKSGPYMGQWDLPGGGIDFGESLEVALRRELYEEVGLTFEQFGWWNNLSVLVEAKNQEHSSTLFHHIGLLYWIKGWRQEAKGEDPHRWIPFEELNAVLLTPFAEAVKRSLLT